MKFYEIFQIFYLSLSLCTFFALICLNFLKREHVKIAVTFNYNVDVNTFSFSIELFFIRNFLCTYAICNILTAQNVFCMRESYTRPTLPRIARAETLTLAKNPGQTFLCCTQSCNVISPSSRSDQLAFAVAQARSWTHVYLNSQTSRAIQREIFSARKPVGTRDRAAAVRHAAFYHVQHNLSLCGVSSTARSRYQPRNRDASWGCISSPSLHQPKAGYPSSLSIAWVSLLHGLHLEIRGSWKRSRDWALRDKVPCFAKSQLPSCIPLSLDEL